MNQFKHGQVWLAEPEARHPFSDLQEARLLVGRLPTGDSMAVLQKITAWVTEIIQIPDFPIQHQLDLIDLFDRLAKNHQLNLIPEYLDAPRMRKLSESHLWTTSFEFWRALSNGYLHCLERYQAAEEGAKDFRRNLPLVACRILRSLTLQLKWTLLRYARVEERLWRDLGRAYLFAESWGFATRRSAIYLGKHGESTAQEELLKALMLAISAPDALTPVQLQIAERIVAHFGSRFSLHTTSGPGCTFMFDLSMHTTPTRARKDAGAAPLLRFFGPGTAAEGLHQMTSHVRQHGMLPPDTNLGGNFDIKVVRSVLEHLARCWSDSAVARRSKRHDVVTRLTVVPGLVETTRWLERMLAEGTANVTNPHAAESWIVFDASDGGCGAVVPSRPADWMAVGALIGVHSETAAVCRMGILRRIASDAYDQHRVGIQFIGEQAAPVALFPATAKNAANLTRPGEPAILISRRPDKHGAIELLLRPGSFMYARALQMRLLDRVLKVERIELIEQDKDYQRVACRLIRPDQ